MERRRELRAGKERGLFPLAQHRNAEARLHRDEALDAEPVQKRAVRDAAAQEDVLAVVDRVAPPLDREGCAAEPLARLVERDVGAAVGALDRRGETGEPAADDGDLWPAHAALARLRASTQPFSQALSEGRPVRTSEGSDAIRASSRL